MRAEKGLSIPIRRIFKFESTESHDEHNEGGSGDGKYEGEMSVIFFFFVCLFVLLFHFFLMSLLVIASSTDLCPGS